MRRLLQVLLVAAALGAPAAVALRANDARASVAYESPYTFDQTFGTAVRLLRVDLGLKITEKDAAGGYLLFDYTSPESGKRVCRGSIEVVRGKDGAHVSVQLPSMPSYHEQMILDALVKKLGVEHGAPPETPKPSPEKPTAPPEGDGGAGDDGGTDETQAN